MSASASSRGCPASVSSAPLRRSHRASAAAQRVVCAAALPPTVADTKRKFVEGYKFPIPAVYSTVVQELLVAQHLSRYNTNYSYNPVSALGFCSVFDQVMEGFPQPEGKELIFKAFMKALDENAEQYRKDATALGAAAAGAGGVEGLAGLEALGAMKAKAAAGALVYSRFVAIGLFRLLELAGAMEPAALAKLVEASGAPAAKVTADLALYKSLLSKLSAAKELLADFAEREKRKAAEREAEKAKAAAEAASAPSTST